MLQLNKVYCIFHCQQKIRYYNAPLIAQQDRATWFHFLKMRERQKRCLHKMCLFTSILEGSFGVYYTTHLHIRFPKRSCFPKILYFQLTMITNKPRCSYSPLNFSPSYENLLQIRASTWQNNKCCSASGSAIIGTQHLKQNTVAFYCVKVDGNCITQCVCSLHFAASRTIRGKWAAEDCCFALCEADATFPSSAFCLPTLF